MPVEICEPKHEESSLVFVDQRKAAEVDGEATGYCGNALLEFDGSTLAVRYRDELGGQLLVEEWTSGGRAGAS